MTTSAQSSSSNEDESYLDFYLLDDGTYGVKAGHAAYLSKIVIPSVYKEKNVTKILENAFYDCESLTSITIPDSVTSIGDYAFSGCSNLTIYFEAESKPSGWGVLIGIVIGFIIIQLFGAIRQNKK